MTHRQHKECFGTIFPDPLHHENERPVRGKVFGYELKNSPGACFRADRTVSLDVAAWDECHECRELQECYMLGIGKLALEAAIAKA